MCHWSSSPMASPTVLSWPSVTSGGSDCRSRSTHSISRVFPHHAGSSSGQRKITSRGCISSCRSAPALHRGETLWARYRRGEKSNLILTVAFPRSPSGTSGRFSNMVAQAPRGSLLQFHGCLAAPESEEPGWLGRKAPPQPSIQEDRQVNLSRLLGSRLGSVAPPKGICYKCFWGKNLCALCHSARFVEGHYAIGAGQHPASSSNSKA